MRISVADNGDPEEKYKRIVDGMSWDTSDADDKSILKLDLIFFLLLWS